MVKQRYRKAIFIVVYRRTKNIFGSKIIKYLLLNRKKHWTGWEFPKGGIDGKENSFETIEREVFEECGQKGFDFRKYKFSGKYKYPKLLKDRPGVIGQTFQLFSAEIKNKKVLMDKREHKRYCWVRFDKALKMIEFDNQRKALKIVNKSLIMKT